MNNWPEYVSHKVVQAMKIVGHDYDKHGTMTAAITEDGNQFVTTVPDMMKRSVVGDYAVLYANDFRSVSPAKEFEEGYTRK
jgi:hypothetical protein